MLKVSEGRPNVVDDIKNGTINLIINALGHRARQDEYAIGWAAIKYRVPFITTLSAAEAIVRGLRANQRDRTSIDACRNTINERRSGAHALTAKEKRRIESY